MHEPFLRILQSLELNKSLAAELTMLFVVNNCILISRVFENNAVLNNLRDGVEIQVIQCIILQGPWVNDFYRCDGWMGWVDG